MKEYKLVCKLTVGKVRLTYSKAAVGYGLPPKKESSFDVRLELKIKGVNHGQEIAFSGADYQQAARS